MESGIYLHIPFCNSKCYYCDFISYAQGESMYKPYVDALIGEIEAYRKRTIEALPINTIFIGGGTPSVLPPILLGKILKALGENFSIARDAEYTIEANPGTLSKEKLQVMKDHGVNRISMGAQAFQNNLLKTIGRGHTRNQIIDSYTLCRDFDFDNINLDLMFSLPTQTLEDWKETLETALALGPDHISAYSLIVEEGTPFGDLYEKGKLDQPDEDLERDMYHFAKDYLSGNGYDQYEISNFSKPGKASRHNINNWLVHPYIGLGLGAHSYYKGHRYHNTEQMQVYINHSKDLKKIQKDKEKIDLKAQMEEFMFLGLRLTRGIKLDEFQKRFNHPLFKVYGSQIEKHKKDHLLEELEGSIFLTNKGQDLSNRVMASFLLD